MNVGRSAAVVSTVVVLVNHAGADGYASGAGAAALRAPRDRGQLQRVAVEEGRRERTRQGGAAGDGAFQTAEAEGYLRQFGASADSDFGAMGMHFVNGALVGDGELDPTRPEYSVIY